MAGSYISIEVYGMNRVVAVLDRLSRPDWDRLLRMMGSIVEDQTINHFQTRRGPNGPWPPLKSRSGQPLVKTGHLRGSIFHAIGGDYVRIGTNVKYGRYHQEGTRTIPERAFLGVTEADKGELKHAIESYIEGIMRP